VRQYVLRQLLTARPGGVIYITAAEREADVNLRWCVPRVPIELTVPNRLYGVKINAEGDAI